MTVFAPKRSLNSSALRTGTHGSLSENKQTIFPAFFRIVFRSAGLSQEFINAFPPFVGGGGHVISKNPATSMQPPIGPFLSKYRRIVPQPILCPTRYVSLSGSPTSFSKSGTHVSILGCSVSGISGTNTWNPFSSNRALSHGYQLS